mgnify:CR=1 FL=1
MNKTLLVILGVLGAVVGTSWYLLRPPSEADVMAAARSGAGKPAAVAAGSSSVVPLETLQKSTPVRIAAARPVVPQIGRASCRERV